MDSAKYKQMSGRAGRTGFDSKGDSIMICRKGDISHVQDLIKPFKCELKSALTGSRLMRSLLEFIASGSIQSIRDLDVYLKNTLKYALCTKDECVHCFKNSEFDNILFGRNYYRNHHPNEEITEKQKKKIYDQFQVYLNQFKLEYFQEDILDDNCRGCIY